MDITICIGSSCPVSYTHLDVYKRQDYTGAGTCSWINQNCWKYGFIVRYTQEKQDITRYGNEPWHFRYVGEPHAYLIRGMGLCMEEYLSTLKQ